MGVVLRCVVLCYVVLCCGLVSCRVSLSLNVVFVCLIPSMVDSRRAMIPSVVPFVLRSILSLSSFIHGFLLVVQ